MQVAQQFERRLLCQVLSILRSHQVKHQSQLRLVSLLAQRPKYREIQRTLHVSAIRNSRSNRNDVEEKDSLSKRNNGGADEEKNQEEIQSNLEGGDKPLNQEVERNLPQNDSIDILPGKPASGMPPDVLKKKPPKLASTLEDRGYLLSDEIFSAVENMKGKTEDGFTLAIEHYKRQSGKYRRGHIEFIDTATKKLKDYNLHQDIKMYKRVFSLFPEKEYIPPTRMMEEFYHMPRHQDAAIQILQEMEDNGLIPDSEIRDMIKDRFSENSEVMYKFQRMVYWMSKFANANPWPVPYHPPDDRIELAKAALRRMSFDINTKIDVWTAENVEDLKAEDEGEEDDFIVSAQSLEQQELIAAHPTDKPVYVEGRHYVYLGSARMTYHVLRTDPPQEGSEFYGIAPDEKEEEFWSEAEEQTAIVPEKSIHEQEDGTILSMCITGSPSQNTLVTWLRCLQDTNPNLENVTVVFKLQEPDAILNYAENHVKEGGPS